MRIALVTRLQSSSSSWPVRRRVRVDAADRGDQAQRQLRGRHFHREDRDRLLGLDRRVLGHVQRERGLAHRGTRGQDDQVGRLQAGGHLVEFGVAGRQAGDRCRRWRGASAARRRLRSAPWCTGTKSLRPRAPASAIANTLLLGAGEDLAAVAAVGLEAVVDDAGADVDQLPQHGLVAHDLGVGGDVGGRRRGAGEFDQVGAAGDLFGRAPATRTTRRASPRRRAGSFPPVRGSRGRSAGGRGGRSRSRPAGRRCGRRRRARASVRRAPPARPRPNAAARAAVRCGGRRGLESLDRHEAPGVRSSAIVAPLAGRDAS